MLGFRKKLKASYTVEASFVMIITLFVVLACVMLALSLYQENYDLFSKSLERARFDAVEAFRRAGNIK